MKILTDSNFEIYAAQHYMNSHCETMEEFQEDLLRFKYLKKLFYSYRHKENLKERLILNHIIVLYNIFEAKACTKMLILKLDGYHDCLFPFLIAMNYLPKTGFIDGIKDADTKLHISDVPLDLTIINKLREILRAKA